MNRDEHMQWAKERALEYVDGGNLTNAFLSLVSDLNKHPETTGHPERKNGMRLFAEGKLNTPEAMRKFIENIL